MNDIIKRIKYLRAWNLIVWCNHHLVMIIFQIRCFPNPCGSHQIILNNSVLIMSLFFLFDVTLFGLLNTIMQILHEIISFLSNGLAKLAIFIFQMTETCLIENNISWDINLSRVYVYDNITFHSLFVTKENSLTCFRIKLVPVLFQNGGKIQASKDLNIR